MDKNKKKFQNFYSIKNKEKSVLIFMYKIYEVGNFKKELNKLLTKKEFLEYEKFKIKLKKGIIIGKPLGFEFFRESEEPHHE